MTERSDPVFVAIERHRLADAAFDDSIDRSADEYLKSMCQEQEATALVALLRTKPVTKAGCIAALRYVADWTENNETGLFHGWKGPRRLAGAAFLPMIADAIETATR
jgi:hypothetical protein